MLTIRILFGRIFFFVLILACSSNETDESLTSESPVLFLIQQIQKEAKSLSDEWKILKLKKTNLKKEKQDLIDQSSSMSDVIRFNVGGELFVTRRKLLSQNSSSKFSILFNGHWEKRFSVDIDGNYLLDVHPKVFHHFLEQLRINENKKDFSFSSPRHLSSFLEKSFEKFLRSYQYKRSIDDSNDVILLNVQGQSMSTRRKQLLEILRQSSEQMKSTSLKDHRYFLDVDPQSFRHTIEQIRVHPHLNSSYFVKSSKTQQTISTQTTTEVPSTTMISKKTDDQGLFTGEIRLYSSTKDPPLNWLRCDGSKVSRLIYSKLFQMIGNLFDVDNEDSTMFQLPDLRGRFPLGRDSNGIRTKFAQQIGQTGGKSDHRLSLNELPSHSHSHGTLKTSQNGAHFHSIDDQGHSHQSQINHSVRRLFRRFFYLFSAPQYDYRIERTNGTFIRRSDIVTIERNQTGIRILNSGEHKHSIEGKTDSTGSGEKYSLMNPFQIFDFLIYAG